MRPDRGPPVGAERRYRIGTQGPARAGHCVGKRREDGRCRQVRYQTPSTRSMCGRWAVADMSSAADSRRSISRSIQTITRKRSTRISCPTSRRACNTGSRLSPERRASTPMVPYTMSRLIGIPSPDRVPGLAGYYDACGGSGHGFKIAPALSYHLARWIIDGTIDDEFARLSYDRLGEGRSFVSGLRRKPRLI